MVARISPPGWTVLFRPRPASTRAPALDRFEPGPALSRLPQQKPGESQELAREMLLGRDLSLGVEQAALRDISAIPFPWLDHLRHHENVHLAVLKAGQTLADTPYLRTSTSEELERDIAAAQGSIEQVLAREKAATAELTARAEADGDWLRAALESRWEGKRIREALYKTLEAGQLGFDAQEVQDGRVELPVLASQLNVPEDGYAEWRQAFCALNQKLAAVEGDEALAPSGVVLVPYAWDRGRRVSKMSLDSYKTVTAHDVRQHRGMHLWENRLIVVHEAFAPDPAEEVGHYRVILHELGHALDFAADALPGLGERHRATVERLFRQDWQELQKGNNRFLTERARDNEREYFAEAVEAYLTTRTSDESDYYKPENCREVLAERNPELFAYVERLLQTAPPPSP